MTVCVSVVVPTCNRPELLNRCLAALVAQNFDPTAYEIIVVDDAVSEATQRLVKDWAERIGFNPQTNKGNPQLHYIPVTGNHGPAAARNLGWQQASSEIIAFTDDDCIPDINWLSAGVAAFKDTVVGVSGRLIVPLSKVPTDYERNAAELEKAAFVTANCFYRKEAIAQINGFDETFNLPWREDSDLLFTLMTQLGMGRKFAPDQQARQLAQFPFVPGKGWIEIPQTMDNYNPKLVYAPEAIVVHPIRPAPWGISISQQKKSRFNALLYKKHPVLYHQWLPPVHPWHYYGIVGSLLAFLGAGLNHCSIGAIVGLTIWLVLTSRFCLKRLHGTSHHPSHIAEMVYTSILVPPISLFWRLWGAIQFHVVFF